MTYFLAGENAPTRRPDPFVGPAPRPLTSSGERFDAGNAKADIDANRGSLFAAGQGMREERRIAVLREIADRLGPPDDFKPLGIVAGNPLGLSTMTPAEHEALAFGGMPPEAVAQRRRQQYLNLAVSRPEALLARAREAADADPESWAWLDYPLSLPDLDLQIDAELNRDYAEYAEILDTGPEDAFAVETLGAISAELATPETAVALALSPLIPGGALARIAGEGAINAGIGQYQFGDRAMMADILDQPAPDRLGTAMLDFSLGAGFQAVGEGLAKGAKLALSPEDRQALRASSRTRLASWITDGRTTTEQAEIVGALDETEAALRAGDPSRIPVNPPPVQGMPSPDALVAAVKAVENASGDPAKVSPAGAVGMMQVLPSTARDPGFGLDNIFEIARGLGRVVPDETDVTLHSLLRDPEVNEAFGIAYLGMLARRYNDLPATLIAYNAGPGIADKWKETGRSLLSLPAETRDYLKKVQARLDRPNRAAQRAAGNDGEMLRTAIGTRHPFRYEVVELDDLIHSHVAGQANPAFPQHLQPRNRDNVASEAQIEEIAAKLDPPQMGRSILYSDGAPVVGKDNVVETGNGRTEALRRVYEARPDEEAAYRQFLSEEQFDTAGFARPVLIRRRLDDLDDSARQRIVQSGNERTTAEPTASERARADARALADDALELFEGGAIGAPGNAAFVARALQSIPASERGALTTRNGRISADGATRIQRMVLARAYDDSRVLELALEEPDELSRNVVNAMQDAAPEAARLRRDIAAGTISSDMDIAGDIADAALRVRDARRNDIPVRDVLSQTDLIRRNPDGLDAAITRMMFADDDMTRIASRQKIGHRLTALVSALRQETTGGLFGEVLRRNAGDIANDILRAEGVDPVRSGVHRSEPPPSEKAPGGAEVKDRKSAPDNRPQASETTPETPSFLLDAPSTSIGEEADDVTRAMQVERDIREALSRDPDLADMIDPDTGMTSAQLLSDLEADADLDAALAACAGKGKT